MLNQVKQVMNLNVQHYLMNRINKKLKKTNLIQKQNKGEVILLEVKKTKKNKKVVNLGEQKKPEEYDKY